MAYEIDPHRVAGVVLATNQVLKDKNFNQGEVILGLAELVGRVIVEASNNKIQADEMVAVVINHMANTIKIGASQQEKRIITGF